MGKQLNANLLWTSFSFLFRASLFELLWYLLKCYGQIGLIRRRSSNWSSSWLWLCFKILCVRCVASSCCNLPHIRVHCASLPAFTILRRSNVISLCPVSSCSCTCGLQLQLRVTISSQLARDTDLYLYGLGYVYFIYINSYLYQSDHDK